MQAAAGLAEKERLVELKALERRLVQTTLSTGKFADCYFDSNICNDEMKTLIETTYCMHSMREDYIFFPLSIGFHLNPTTTS